MVYIYNTILFSLKKGGNSVTTKLDELGAKVMTKENKKKAKKGLKVFGIIAGAVLAIDAISAIIYFLCWARTWNGFSV